MSRDWANLFDSVLDNTAAGIFITDKDFKIVYWNKVLSDWTGLTKDDVFNKDLLVLFPHLRSKRFKIRLDMVLKGGPPVLFSPQLHPHFIHCEMKDGFKMIQQTIVSYLDGGEDKSKMLHFTITDMTLMMRQIKTVAELKAKAVAEFEQREALAKRLAIREKIFKSQYKSMPIPTYTLEKVKDDFVVFDFNFAAEQTDLKIIPCEKGVSAKIALSNHFDILVDTVDCYKNKNSHSNNYSIEYDGNKYYLKIMFTFIEPNLVMMHVEDRTVQKEYDESKKESAALKSAMAVAVSVSHEINQPLMIIQGALEMLEITEVQNRITQKQGLYLEKIMASTGRIQSMINKFTSLETLKFKKYIEDIDMIDFDDDIIE
jgi:PAS domain S-box-containing protein